jgi:hypothetical protein
VLQLNQIHHDTLQSFTGIDDFLRQIHFPSSAQLSRATLPLPHLPSANTHSLRYILVHLGLANAMNHGKPRSYLEDTAVQIGHLPQTKLLCIKIRVRVTHEPTVCHVCFLSGQRDGSLGCVREPSNNFPGSAFCGEEKHMSAPAPRRHVRDNCSGCN